MGEAAAIMSPSSATPATEDLITESAEEPALFHRRIEFHLARKPFNGFNGNRDKGGFRLETLNPSPSPGPGPMNANRNLEGQKGKSELAENNGLDPELLGFRITFRRIGAGLQNLGNTCFLNSVLQCLTYTEPLAAYLQSGKHQNSCRTAGFCALCAIQKHVSRALNSTGRILAPKDLVSNLRCISRNFRNARQEDAHEYMVNLLESMHKCCLPSGVPSESPSAYERSLVHKIFGGRLRSQVKCLQCSYCSNKFDPFLDLSLEIMKADSVKKALFHFTAKEQLDGGERQYQCQQCKQKVKALKQLTIYKPPHVLTIHLKRFGSHVAGQKIDKKITFDPTLDLKPFVTGPYEGDLKYTLYGVLVHAGWSTHSGHYYCFVRTSSGMWYSLDDNQVVQVNERKVLEQKAYMLFYVRDQRNSVPKKPVDVVQKENMVISAMGNKAASSFKLGLKEAMQNGPLERKSNISCALAAAQGDALNASAANEAPMTSVNNNRPMGDKLPSLQRDAGTSTNVSSQKDSIVPTLNGGEFLKQSALPVTAFDRTLHTAKATVNVENGTEKDINASFSRLGDHNVAQFTTKKERNDSCTKPTSCNGHVDVKKAVIDTVDRPPNDNILLGASVEVSTTVKTDSSKHDSKEALAVAVQEASHEIANKGSSPWSNGENSQDGISSKSCSVVDSTDQSTLNVGQRPRFPTGLKTLSQEKALDKKAHLAVKKKLFKSHMGKMHLSTNIIFGTSLGLRKRKKHKRSRLRNLENKNSSQGDLMEGNCNGSVPGPSASEKVKKLSRDLSDCSQKKRRKGDKLVVKDAAESVGLQRVIDEEFRLRVGQNGIILSTEKQTQRGPNFASVDHLSQMRERGSLKDARKDVNQNSLTSILTRGLEERTVPKWDGVELSATGITESEGVASVSIGYVGDEWDEEYDRGKQKKVRGTKVNFGGQNPFQEIANKKAKRKRVKLESSSGSEPFRI